MDKTRSQFAIDWLRQLWQESGQLKTDFAREMSRELRTHGVEVTPVRIEDWLRKNKPQTDMHWALVAYLRRRDCNVQEWSDAHAWARPLLELIGTGRVSVAQVQKRIGHKNLSTTSQVLLGRNNVTEDVLADLQRWIGELGVAMPSEVQVKDAPPMSAPPPFSPKVVEAVGEIPAAPAFGLGKTQAAQTAAAMIVALDRLVQPFLGSEATPEDRQLLRDLAGSGTGVFRLVNSLTPLCSETAFNNRHKK